MGESPEVTKYNLQKALNEVDFNNLLKLTDINQKNDVSKLGLTGQQTLDQIAAQGKQREREIGVQGDVDLSNLLAKQGGDYNLQSLIGTQGEKSQKTSGQQALEQLAAKASSDKALQELINKQELDVQKVAGQQRLAEMQGQNYYDTKLQDLTGKQALAQIEGRGGIEKDIQNLSGQQALEQLKLRGGTEKELQELSGRQALEQLMAKGGSEQDLQKLIGQQQLGLQESAQKFTGDQNQMNRQDYLNAVNRAAEGSRGGESGFLAANQAPNQYLDEYSSAIKNNSTAAQELARKQMAASLAQQGVRGGQAATIMGRSLGELNRNLGNDLTSLRYNDEQSRKKALQDYYSQKSLAGSQASYAYR